MTAWADSLSNLASVASDGSVQLAHTEVTFTSTTTYEVALTIGHAGSPGVSCTRTDTGTYALAFPTADVQFLRITPSLGATFMGARVISLDLDAGTAAFETFVDDTGTARRDDLNLASAKFVVSFFTKSNS